jgi:small-conductance mechanosensitive channel
MTFQTVVDAVPTWAMGPVTFLAVTAAFYIIGKLLVRPLASRVMARRSDHLSGPFGTLSFYLTFFAGIAIALTSSGYGQILGVFGTIMAAGTLAIGFAMQDTIAAAVSGFFLFIDKPFETGDWIEWADNKGRVKEISLRTTKIETFDNELLTVPNDQLANATIKNPVANDRLRVQLDVGIGYSDDIEEAKTIVTEILQETDGIMDDPGPDVMLVGLGDSTVDLKARYWVPDPKRAKFMSIKQDVLYEIKERFDAAEIDMPYPTITIAGESLGLRE